MWVILIGVPFSSVLGVLVQDRWRKYLCTPEMDYILSLHRSKCGH